MEKNLEKQIQDFLLDSDVEFSKEWSLSRDAFHILEPNEMGHSKMIGWLLSPKEGHFLGDYFIKRLLKEVFLVYRDNNSKTLPGFEYLEEAGFKSVLDIETQSFHDTFVELEFPISKNGRVDIALINYEKKLIIFIENKYSASIHNDQLSKYQKWQCKYDDSFKMIYIFMDNQENFSNVNSPWIALTYRWLRKACKDVLNRERVSKETNILIRDYYSFLEGDYEFSPLHKGIEARFSKIYNKHRNLLDEIKKKNFIKKKHSLLLSSNGEDSKNDFQLFQFYLNYNYLLEELFDYNRFDYLKELLMKKLSEKKLPTNWKRDFFEFRSIKWQSLEIDPKNYWGLYIRLIIIKNEDKSEKGQRVEVLGYTKNLSEKGLDSLDKIAKAFKTKLKMRKNASNVTIFKQNVKENEPDDIANRLAKIFLRIDNLL